MKLTLAAQRSILVLVDYQERLMPAIHDGARVVNEALVLADVARTLDIPVLGTEQNPKGLGPNVPAIRERCAATLAKMHFDGCRDGLLALLREHRRDVSDVAIAGCEAHVCLMQTALGLLGAGLHVQVVASACGSRFPADHALAMERLRAAGAVLASAEMTAFEWLESCEHARFKPVLARLKSRDG